MLRVAVLSTPVLPFHNRPTIYGNLKVNFIPGINFARIFSSRGMSLSDSTSPSLTNFLPLFGEGHTLQTPFFTRVVSSSLLSDRELEYGEEPATKVKFQTSLSLPGCPSLLSLVGTGYREKVFAIIGVKVYAAGFYMSQSILTTSDDWKRKSASGNPSDSSLFNSILHGPYEKSLQIVLVRNVDGKTFWEALDEAISPKLKPPTQTDESVLLAFQTTFQSRSMKKGTIIVLTWLNTSTMLVCVSPDGDAPLKVDAEIDSENVSSALFHVFFGDSPVSPTLKASVAEKLATMWK